jgi:tagaturonate reductase
VGRPLGLESVRAALADADVATFLAHALHAEVLPSLPGPLHALQTYTNEVLSRFRNPTLYHALGAIALNMESKCLTRLWPALQSHQQRNSDWPPGLVLGLALARRDLQREQQSTALLDAQVAQSPGLEQALRVACARVDALGLRATLAVTEGCIA